ncbi:MAG: dehydrogenase [Planctomycetaceae bacterium]|nr:dehydrogenase [Planctomycetaceae bacterium]
MRVFGLIVLILSACTAGLSAQEFIPRRQSKPPGPPLSPREAIARMQVPEGFSVELVASEPMIQNPVAMCFDEQGRIWITESFEYPRREPGPGRDRIKVLEDTNGDGQADKMTIFAEGLNIPSGIAVGHGGVWVGNAPDILFLQDTDGDLKADRREVIVTGFGRTDTHELPNSFTWGPDGWLYGLNGVFNYCHVNYSPGNPNYREGQPGWKFDAAIFRIHPRTREFQIFAEGTSNPWGIAFDNRGEMFLSACVIDHLWHITRGGYYHRQAGAYPPFTWKIESIVDYKHQLAAYCGIEHFDSEAYPEAYRNKLYMGNIHGNCINVDGLARQGASYKGVKHDDFLTANDVWFMPVSQKTGPEGCLYVLDWYDRYHCYQDANADPAGVDRGHGRLYRIRHLATPRPSPVVLEKQNEGGLLGSLGHSNQHIRNTARRLLQEILFEELLSTPQADGKDGGKTRRILSALAGMIRDDSLSATIHQGALSVLISAAALATSPELSELDAYLARHGNPEFRRAAIRMRSARADVSVGQSADADAPSASQQVLFDQLFEFARDESRDVLLQTAIATSSLHSTQARAELLLTVQSKAGDDELIPRIVWRRLEAVLAEQGSEAVIKALESHRASGFANLDRLLPRITERALAHPRTTPEQIGQLFSMFAIGTHPKLEVARQCLNFLAERIRNRELAGESLQQVRLQIDGAILEIVRDERHPLHRESVLLATSWKYPPALELAERWASDKTRPADGRVAAFDAVAAADESRGMRVLKEFLAAPQGLSPEQWRTALNSAGRMTDAALAQPVITAYPQFPPTLRPAVIDLLTQRKSWGNAFVAAVRGQQLSREDINATQLRRLLEIADEPLAAEIIGLWGKVRDQPQVDRQRAIARAQRIIRTIPGDPHRGILVYNRICGQCHKLHGEGADVGPDLTRNGRNNFAQLLSNVFDPNLVIGEAYQARTIVTEDGRVVTGLVAEDNEARVVLKLQGAKTVTIPRDEIEFMKISDVSLMPEQLETQMTEQELADLFMLLTLDKHPGDQAAVQLAGVRELETLETQDPLRYESLIVQLAPGFICNASGHRGIAWLAEFRGRRGVLRTHPVSPQQPCELVSKTQVPAGKQTRLLLEVASHPQADWQLRVVINGQPAITRPIADTGTPDSEWTTLELDLTPYAGQTITLSLQAHGLNRWNSEYAYWSQIDIQSTQPE